MLYTPNRIHSLASHQIFVFGSNIQGRHGAGAARQALQFGAIYWQPRGRQGQTYAIVTKDLDRGKRSIPLKTIHQEIHQFLDYVATYPEWEFLVTEIGCGLAGYHAEEMVKPFQERFGSTLGQLPDHIKLPKRFWDVAEG
jgi:hypothetical protein